MLLKVFVLFGVFTTLCAEKFKFTDYALYKVVPQNDTQVKWLVNLQNEFPNYDFWKDPIQSGDEISILTSPEDKEYLNDFLRRNQLQSELITSNIQTEIDKETFQKYSKGNLRSMGWVSYYEIEDIYDWLDDLTATYSEATEIIGGTTFEGRAIKGVKISHGSGKKKIFIEGGIHAREWISPATVNYIINELLTSDDPDTQAAARDFDWYIFPVTNPDGYVWTYESFRMWRKNRRPTSGGNIGIDLNRNWNSNWLVIGASSNPADDTYAGPGPFSEIESRTLSNFIASIRDDMELYLSFHSFGQMLLLPFGNSTLPLANYQEAMNVGRRAMGALSVRYGTQYRTGNIPEVLVFATGSSIDWVKEHLKTPLVYAYELRDTSTFLLPPSQILPNCEETMDSVIELLHQGKRFGLLNSSMRINASVLFMLAGFFVKYLL